MMHKVLILDDQRVMAAAARDAAALVDREADFRIVYSVDDAKQELAGHLSEFRYAIIDLDMRGKPPIQQGEALLKWLEERDALQQIEILVVSSYPDRLRKLPRSIKQHVSYKERNSYDGHNAQIIRAFVETAMHPNVRAGS